LWCRTPTPASLCQRKRKDQQKGEILRFVRFWKNGPGGILKVIHLLTTYAKLAASQQARIPFITRRRSPGLKRKLSRYPAPRGDGSS
jgi:hypothetical protein